MHAPNPLIAAGVTASTRSDRRSLCAVHFGGCGAAAHVRSELEQSLVHAFGFCGDQLYGERGLRHLRGWRVVVRRIWRGDLAQPDGPQNCYAHELIDAFALTWAGIKRRRIAADGCWPA